MDVGDKTSESGQGETSNPNVTLGDEQLVGFAAEPMIRDGDAKACRSTGKFALEKQEGSFIRGSLQSDAPRFLLRRILA